VSGGGANVDIHRSSEYTMMQKISQEKVFKCGDQMSLHKKKY